MARRRPQRWQGPSGIATAGRALQEAPTGPHPANVLEEAVDVLEMSEYHHERREAEDVCPRRIVLAEEAHGVVGVRIVIPQLPRDGQGWKQAVGVEDARDNARAMRRRKCRH